MNIAVWIVSGLLAAAYLFAGTNKATRPKDKLVDSLPWAEDFSPRRSSSSESWRFSARSVSSCPG